MLSYLKTKLEFVFFRANREVILITITISLHKRQPGAKGGNGRTILHEVQINLAHPTAQVG